MGLNFTNSEGFSNRAGKCVIPQELLYSNFHYKFSIVNVYLLVYDFLQKTMLKNINGL